MSQGRSRVFLRRIYTTKESLFINEKRKRSNWRSNIACLAVGIYLHWTDHGSFLAVNKFYACRNLVKFIFKSFVSCNLQFQAFYIRHTTVYKSIFWACKKNPAGTSRFSFRARNFLSFLAQWARTQASSSLTKFLIMILRRRGKLYAQG